jgi:ABC-type multidrug transport system fused ATPase/permease subunit
LNNSSLSKQDFTGKIFNTLSTDFEIFELIHYSLYVFSIPIVATVSIGVIYIYFDAIGIISIGIIVLHLPLIALISNISSKFREKAEKNCDTRVKMIERLIQGIKLMKFYVWEKKFYEKICEERKKEVKNRRRWKLWIHYSCFVGFGDHFQYFSDTFCICCEWRLVYYEPVYFSGDYSL